MSTKLRTRLEESGFTLIEAMILSAILAILIATFTQYTLTRARLIKNANERRNQQHVAVGIKSSAAQAESLSRTEELQWQKKATPTPTP